MAIYLNNIKGIVHVSQGMSRLVLLLLLQFVAVGCSKHYGLDKSKMIEKRAEVHQSLFAKRFKADEIDNDAIGELAKHYRRHGEGALNVLVTYKPEKNANKAYEASKKGSNIVKRIRAHGIETVNLDVARVEKEEKLDAFETLIHYKQLHAKGPSDCKPMSVLTNAKPAYNREDVRNYKLGCTIETMLARQVIRPGDLLGKSPISRTLHSGRRAGNIINRYEKGEPNEPLEGATASDIATGN